MSLAARGIKPKVDRDTMACKPRQAAAILCIVAAYLVRSGASAAQPPPSAPAEEKHADRLLALAGDGFEIRETDHFLIAYDTSYEAVRPLVGRLEGTYKALARFCRGCGIREGGSDAPLEVILFDQSEDFARYLETVGIPAATMAGIYDQRTNIAAFSNTFNHPDLDAVGLRIEQIQAQLRRLSGGGAAARSNDRRRSDLQQQLLVLQTRRDAIVKQFNRFVIQHEAAHQMFFNLGMHVRGAANPPWLVEGLACQFEVPQPVIASGRVRINHMRLGDFRDALGVARRETALSESAYQDAVTRGRIVPMADLVSDPELFSGRDKNVPYHYAQAWACVYYLYKTRRQAFKGYAQRVKDRRPGERVDSEQNLGDFQDAFGVPDREFERAWIDHILRLRYDPREAGR
jgi:hypothetical protein